ncbi:hypothetical protein [Moorena sp. SIO3I6]|uniref:hypothetical protein n=1 Tax=Moorena sp. SIO3I6 TaxID=2607831 RepID=UPI0013F83455|nr:hypothetical protein [Moorena sp. SIO3I6]NEP24610.1 hypothetical protein [Moorena sp. SIO3I6]
MTLPPCLDAARSWGKPRQLLMGGTPKTALAPQDRAASLFLIKNRGRQEQPVS